MFLFFVKSLVFMVKAIISVADGCKQYFHAKAKELNQHFRNKSLKKTKQERKLCIIHLPSTAMNRMEST
jgi:hypothetical protein